MSSIETIRKLCKDKGISVTVLEQELGFGNGSLTKTNNIRSDRLEKVADYFNVSVDYILGRESDKIQEEQLYRLAEYAVMLHNLERLDSERQKMAAKYIRWLLLEQEEEENGKGN